MGRIYSSGYANTTASTVVKELFNIQSAASAITVLHEVLIGNRSSVSEMVAYSICRTGTTGVLGTTAAIAPLNVGEPAFGGVVAGVAGSSNATGLTVLYRENVNILNGWHYLPAPEDRIFIQPSAKVVIRRESSPTDNAMDVTVILEEI